MLLKPYVIDKPWKGTAVMSGEINRVIDFIDSLIVLDFVRPNLGLVMI